MTGVQATRWPPSCESPHFLYVMRGGRARCRATETIRRARPVRAGHAPVVLPGRPHARLRRCWTWPRRERAEQQRLEIADVAATRCSSRPEARDRLIGRSTTSSIRLRELETKGKDSEPVPDVHARSWPTPMRQETQLLIQNVVFEEESSFLNIYRRQLHLRERRPGRSSTASRPPRASRGSWFELCRWSRGAPGFLTHGAFLAVFSHPDINSPTRRGLFVQETLLVHRHPAAASRGQPHAAVAHGRGADAARVARGDP